MRIIPESELHISFTASGGPGGQNVNKTATKVQLRWPVQASSVFSAEEKAVIVAKLTHRLTQEGAIAIDISEERSQLQNKQRAIELLHTLVNDALVPEVPRVPTRVPRRAKAARLQAKRQRGATKQLRKPVNED